MAREDVITVANILRHSDVVISPGSTITIETAIFDTPTIVPVFHTYQPELGSLQFNQHLATHFRRLQELDLVPIVNDSESLVQAIHHALNDRTWYQQQRAQLVREYICYTDGKSTQRLADLICKLIH
jgi:CDP-glycerol glycerophosphotransferase (TagB/SpsB family)